MIGGVYLAMTTAYFLLSDAEGSEVVIKWLLQRKETIRLVCPHKHVIYNPSILAGSSSHNCTKKSEYIQAQLNACFWRQRCELSITNCDKISCDGRKRKVDHLVIDTPYCIPKGIIYDACEGKKQFKGRQLTKGVIRSHKGYPDGSNKQTGYCDVFIPIRKSDTLVIASVSNGMWRKWPDYTRLVTVARDTLKEEVFNTTDKKTLMLPGNVTAGIRVIAKFNDRPKRRRRRKKHINKGFVMPFVAYNSDSLHEIINWPKSSRPVLRDIGWIYEVRGVVEQCMTGRKQGKVTLTCDKGAVIYSPAFSTSAYTRSSRTRCIYGRYPCGGFTSQALMQQKSCFWSSSCDITWTGSDTIILSKRRHCIGYMASNLGLSGHRCVPKGNIFDLCTNCTDLIKAEWGIVRSHPQYPWYFDNQFSSCKRVLKIGKRNQLLLLLQDINLDPDGRDKFTIEHIVRGTRQEIMNAKSATEGRQLILRGGKVVIKLTPFKKTKAGRGFVIVFRRRPNIKGWPQRDVGYQQTDFYAGDQAPVDDATMADIRLSNRRLCSGSKQQRRKGRACGRRVWSDYFTRLE